MGKHRKSMIGFGSIQLGIPVSGDYFDTIWENFTTLAHAWEGGTNYTDRIAAFGYWEAGDGKIFNMNWRIPNFP